MKYIVTVCVDGPNKGKEELFIFPKSINHDDMAEVVSFCKQKVGHGWERFYKQPVSAGFFDGTNFFGRSETLDLDSRPAQDQTLYSKSFLSTF